MSVDVVLFYLYAACAIAGASGVIAARRLVHAVMSLLVSVVAIAAIYLLMGSEFLAAMQLFVYGGAVTILALFALVLTRPSPEVTTNPGRVAPWIAGIAAAALLASIITAAVSSGGGALRPAPGTDVIALSLFGTYTLPFEVAGLILTIALTGAIAVAREDKHANGVADPGAQGEERDG